MAGLKPSFITGATAKIKLGGLTMAYAQDVSYNVQVTTIPIETCGRYEPISIEPVSYNVSGTLSVIRYTQQAALSNMSGASPTGNGVGSWNMPAGMGGKGSNSFNPGKMLISETFDLEIFQKTVEGATGNDSADQQLLISKIIDCRFTSMGTQITKRGVLTQQFAFQAILVGDDSFTAERSGDYDLV